LTVAPQGQAFCVVYQNRGGLHIFLVVILGMSQVWYVGLVALKVGEAPYGGDIGFELGLAFAFSS